MEVLFFSTGSVLADFTCLTANTSKEVNGESLALYLDDVNIYNRSVKKYLEHVRCFLNLLQGHKLLAKGSKCKVIQEEVYFLRQYVSAGNLCMNYFLGNAVEEWPTPSSITDVQNFQVFQDITENSSGTMLI